MGLIKEKSAAKQYRIINARSFNIFLYSKLINSQMGFCKNRFILYILQSAISGYGARISAGEDIPSSSLYPIYASTLKSIPPLAAPNSPHENPEEYKMKFQWISFYILPRRDIV